MRYLGCATALTELRALERRCACACTAQRTGSRVLVRTQAARRPRRPRSAPTRTTAAPATERARGLHEGAHRWDRALATPNPGCTVGLGVLQTKHRTPLPRAPPPTPPPRRRPDARGGRSALRCRGRRRRGSRARMSVGTARASSRRAACRRSTCRPFASPCTCAGAARRAIVRGAQRARRSPLRRRRNWLTTQPNAMRSWARAGPDISRRATRLHPHAHAIRKGRAPRIAARPWPSIGPGRRHTPCNGLLPGMRRKPDPGGSPPFALRAEAPGRVEHVDARRGAERRPGVRRRLREQRLGGRSRRHPRRRSRSGDDVGAHLQWPVGGRPRSGAAAGREAAWRRARARGGGAARAAGTWGAPTACR